VCLNGDYNTFDLRTVLSRMLKSLVHCSVISFYVWFNFVSTLLVCIVSLTGKLTYMSLMSRVTSLNVSLIVSRVIFSAAYVLGICKIFMIFG